MPQSRFRKLQFSNRKSARIDDKLIVFLSIRFEFSIIENHPTTSFEKVQYSERRFNSFLRFVLSHSLKNQSSRAEKLHDLCEFSKPSLSLSLSLGKERWRERSFNPSCRTLDDRLSTQRRDSPLGIISRFQHAKVSNGCSS